MDLCKYKDVLLSYGENIHKYKFKGISIVDVVLTIIFGIVLTKLLKTNYFYGILLSFLLGIIFHELFCIETPINKKLKQLIH